MVKAERSQQSEWPEYPQMGVVIAENLTKKGAKFFAESCYVITLKSPNHTFIIQWIGTAGLGQELSYISEGTLVLTGGIVYTTQDTRVRIKKVPEADG